MSYSPALPTPHWPAMLSDHASAMFKNLTQESNNTFKRVQELSARTQYDSSGNTPLLTASLIQQRLATSEDVFRADGFLDKMNATKVPLSHIEPFHAGFFLFCETLMASVWHSSLLPRSPSYSSVQTPSQRPWQPPMQHVRRHRILMVRLDASTVATLHSAHFMTTASQQPLFHSRPNPRCVNIPILNSSWRTGSQRRKLRCN